MNSVERVFKVHLNENGIEVIPVPLHPLARGPQTDLCPQGLSNANLERPKQGASLILESGTQSFGDQTAEALADRNGANGTVFFRKRKEGRTSQPGSERSLRATLGEDADKRRKMPQRALRARASF